jgi:4-alpha-glucanotransferase
MRDGLARRLGITREYESAWGDRRRISEETLSALVASLGYEPGTSEASLEAQAWSRWLEPVYVVEGQSTEGIDARPPASGALRWSVELEDGSIREGALEVTALTASSRRGEQVQVRLPLPVHELPLGYHRLTVREARSGETATASLVVVPTRAFTPGAWEEHPGHWAITAQLYSLKTERNWGIGDFTDLAELIRQASRHGASAVGLNPLHALFLDDPAKRSPYSPSSRSFLHPIYLDVTAVPELEEAKAVQALIASAELQEKLKRARESSLVDYPLVWECKERVLRALFAVFLARHFGPQGASTERGRAFERFRDAAGPSLRALARFEERGASEEEPLFGEYLQWESDRQLALAAESARRSGMSIGLYRDIAVGVNPGGADARSDPAVLARGASVGAPPDIFNPKGQDWGLVPFNPHAVRERAYAPFIEVVRANMRHAGAVRIDHVLGLKRLWWIPSGSGPADGGYVQYPIDDLIGIIALESHRHRCFVVGEDLGTVPAGFREEMARRAILSYRLLIFEREGKTADGEFREPAQYPPLAAAAVSTHDLATFHGLWTGEDLKVRRALSLYPSDDSAAADVERRKGLRKALVAALSAHGGLAPAETEDLEALSAAAHRFLARSRAKFLLVQLEDLLGQREQMNLPGTVDEHPNWRRKLAVSLSSALDGPLARRILRAVEEVRAAPRK